MGVSLVVKNVKNFLHDFFNRKVFFSSLLLLLVCSMLLTGCSSVKSKKLVVEVPTGSILRSIGIVTDADIFRVGVPATFQVVFSEDSDIEGIVWSVLDTSRATIDDAGVLMPLSEGYVTVVAKSKETGEVLASYSFVAFREDASVLILTEDNSSRFETSTPKSLIAEFGSAPTEDVKWISGNPDIATVDPDTGVVTGLIPGSTRLYAVSVDGEDRVLGYKDITITLPGELGYLTTLDEGPLDIGDTRAFSATLSNPETYSDSEIVWSVEDDGIASVDSNGIVTAKNGGRTTVCAKVGDALVGCESFVVVNPGESIWLEWGSDESRVRLNEEVQFEPVIPESMSGIALTWQLSNTSVGNVNDTGLVSWLSGGIATLEVYNGSTLLASRELTFDSFAAEILPEDGNMIVEIGQVETFSISYTPSDPGIAVVWSVVNDSVATVSDGEVTGVSGGVTSVLLHDSDGILLDMIEIVVVNEGETVWLNADPSGEVPVNGSVEMAVVVPDDVDEDDIEWSVTDTSIATVSHDGVVSWVSAGETTVNAVLDGQVVGTKRLTFESISATLTPVSGIPEVYANETLQFNVAFTPSGTGFSSYTWDVDDTGVATISSSGLATGIAAGDVTVLLKHSVTGEVLGSLSVSVLGLEAALAELEAGLEVPLSLAELRPLAERILGLDSESSTGNFVNDLAGLAEDASEEELTFIESNIDEFKALVDDGVVLKNPESQSTEFDDMDEGSPTDLVVYGDLLYYAIDKGDEKGLYTFNTATNEHLKLNDNQIGGMDIYGDILYMSVLNDDGGASINIVNLVSGSVGFRNDASLRTDLEVVNDDYILLVNDDQNRIRVASKNVIDKALSSNADGTYILDGEVLDEYDRFFFDSDGTYASVLATDLSVSKWSGGFGAGTDMGLYLYTIDDNDDYVRESYVTLLGPATPEILYDYRYSMPKVKIHNGYVYASYSLGVFRIYEITGSGLVNVYSERLRTLTSFDVSGDTLILNRPRYTYSSSQVTGAVLAAELTSYDISDPSNLRELKKVVSVKGANTDMWGGTDVHISEGTNKVVVRAGNSILTFSLSDFEE
jgi:uncharacterized protein YjdB